MNNKNDSSCSVTFTYVCVKGRVAAKDGYHLSKWRIKLIKMSQEEMTASWKVLQAPDPVLSNCASCISCYLQKIYSVSPSVLTVNLSQILLHHTIWVLPQVNIFNITATSDQSLQENRKSSLVVVDFYYFYFNMGISSMLEIMDWCSQFLSENEAVCKCWYCKYTGSVFFSPFF